MSAAEEVRATLLGMLRDLDPDSHLLDCPDTVTVPGSPQEPLPALDGPGRWELFVWSLQCGHGVTSAKFDLHVHIVERPEETEP